MSRDPHSYACPDEARVTHLDLDLAVDFDKKRIAGQVALDVTLAPGAHEVVLDTRDLELYAVTDAEGAPLPHRLGERDPLLGTSLTVDLSGGARRIVIRYTTGPDAPALDWLSPAQTAGGEHPFLFTQGHALQTRSYIPTQDSPAIRQTYAARITVPSPLVALMSAEHLGVTDAPGGAGKTFSFRMREPLPPYLIALAVGDLGFRATGPRTGVFAEPSLLDRAAHEFAEIERMIDVAEGLLGPYRWGRFDVLVMPPSFPYGGMENPRLTFTSAGLLAGDRSLTTVVAHELAHAWAGNLVVNANWDDFWLNEGFTVYVELRMNELLWGKERVGMLETYGWRELSAEIERLGPTSPDTRLCYEMKGRDPVVGVTVVPYLKGMSFLAALEKAVGRPRFDAWLRGWFDRHAFQSVTTADLEQDLGEHLFGGGPAPLDLDRWLRAPGLLPEAAPAPSRALAEVDARAADFLAGAPAVSLGAGAWCAQEWRHFLGTLLGKATSEQLAALDDVFGLAESGNHEVRFAFLRAAARSRHTPVLPAIERFLGESGRGKFVRPLYNELLGSDWGREVAHRAYAASRPRYHRLLQGALDPLFSKP
ncbi:MAG: M1 family metallopeptidase [Byssovorax sp.]